MGLITLMADARLIAIPTIFSRPQAPHVSFKPYRSRRSAYFGEVIAVFRQKIASLVWRQVRRLD
jgi:hypothetical protein